MRNILIVAGGVALVLALAAGAYFGLARSGGSSNANAAPADNTQVAQFQDVLKVLPDDHVLGNPDAPITIIEYGSLTCPHCAYFAVNTLPELKKQYIDTGKAKLVFRNFPRDEYDLRAFTLAECAGNNRYFAMLDVLFASQATWIKIGDLDGTVAELGRVARLAGMPESEFKACMANTALQQGIVARRQALGDKIGLQSTPTFFINGVKAEGAMPFDQFEKLLK
jgi:protein-disulfide isomerase